MPKVLDVYCGMGGLSLGFALGLDSARIDGVDINRDAVATYNLNLRRFGCRAIKANALEWEPDDDYDIVIGGPPCQPFSIANTRRRGKEHELYPTFPRFFDIILMVKPKAFLMENVKGLLSKTHKHLLDEQLSKVLPHYRVTYRVLNAAYYGIPQRRERLFLVGVRKDLRVKPSLPKPTHHEVERVTLTGRLFKWVTVGEAIGDLISIVPVNLILPDEVTERIKEEREDTERHWGRMDFPDRLDIPSRTISSHTVEGSKRETIVIPVTEHEVKLYDMKFSKKSLDSHPPQDLNTPASTIRASFYKVPPDATIKFMGKYRRLSVRECLRLQSFPDWWVFPKGISISRKYKLVGEAVPPILAYRLAVHIGKMMGWETREPPTKEEWDIPYFSKAFADYVARNAT